MEEEVQGSLLRAPAMVLREVEQPYEAEGNTFISSARPYG